MGIAGNPFIVLAIPLFGILWTAIMIMIYHCIFVRWCNRRRNPLRHLDHQQEDETPNGLEISFIQLIPVHKYKKADGKGGEGDNTCPVCLGEFKEGEDVRRLPECLHSFHVPCIDMWFYSHSNCPLCRAEMTPSPLRPSAPPDSGGLSHIGV